MIDFKNINYLKIGNDRQKRAYRTLKEYQLFEKLKLYQPILTGTVPIDIDIPESDLDIICRCENHKNFSKFLQQEFSSFKNFKSNTKRYDNIETTICRFSTQYFPIEIFAQNIDTVQQNAYKHMIIEYKLLNKMGDSFKENIRYLKLEGIKTEPAFALLLKLEGDPYKELLNYEI
ncbi:DUF4269 domain-containing protein [Aureibacter tunicatorum]|uniref:DUF4269 domain-containing protein n=1 Tax=Aureibacter tunicatorum TaxID=866807 RepID=A0AAE3XRY9_9BACT|nr:DUF4269 domain-containing protein [Aureibacter tunicatorum]MDR6240811.1 hypothetical protein [Aureibacter tunicatorum]BDD06856.1 alpha/beta hydrolase [Aureibacter tunicatorum]